MYVDLCHTHPQHNVLNFGPKSVCKEEPWVRFEGSKGDTQTDFFGETHRFIRCSYIMVAIPLEIEVEKTINISVCWGSKCLVNDLK